MIDAQCEQIRSAFRLNLRVTRRTGGTPAAGMRAGRQRAPTRLLTTDSHFYISRNMKKTLALEAFGALAQETRLDIFRRLIREFPDPMAAGDLAKALDVPPSTLSAHLGILSRAGLVKSERQGRTIFYAADTSGAQALLTYLIKDCCRGKPEICKPLLDAATPVCC
jgi:DNA-binding transcriptional ArsR family regulator